MSKFSDQLLADLVSEHGAALQEMSPLSAAGGRPRAARRAHSQAGPGPSRRGSPLD